MITMASISPSPLTQLYQQTSSVNNKRVRDIDNEIARLTHEVERLNDFTLQADIQHSLLSAKLKRQKLAVLAAVANSQVLLNEMEMLSAECDLNLELARIKQCKKRRLDLLEGSSEPGMSQKPQSARYPSSTQSSSSTKEKKSTSRSKSKKKNNPNLDDTIILEQLNTDTNSDFPIVLNNYRGVNKSPSLLSNGSSVSESSLTNSLVSEFNKPYTNEKKTQNSKKVDHLPKISNVTSLKNKNGLDTKENVPQKRSTHSLSSKRPKQPRPSLTVSLPIPNVIPVHHSSTPIKHSLPAIITKPSNNTMSSQIRSQEYQHNSIPYTPQNICMTNLSVNNQNYAIKKLSM